MIQLNYKEARPLYEQIKESIRKMVISNAFLADEKLPSVREMASQLAVNPNAIERAYQELEREGYIYTMKGKGSFVSESSEAADSKREEIKRELGECVDKALAIGIRPQQLETMLQDCVKNSTKGGNTI